MATNRLQPKEIERCVGNVVARLRMKLDAPMPSNRRCRVLLVEGKTDEVFFSDILEDDVKCFSMGGILRARSAIKSDDICIVNNNKEAIMQTVYGLNVLPALINVKGAENWLVYGVVDRDYEDFSLYSRSKGLYVTDTHDIETLILSSDEKIWDRIAEGNINQQNIKKALYVAFHLALLRDSIKNNSSITLRPVKSGSSDIEFSSFLDNYTISLPDLMEYINERNRATSTEKVLGKNDLNKLMQCVAKDKGCKKILSPEGKVKDTYEAFSPKNIGNYWVWVDGHDILALIKYFDEYASARYLDESSIPQRRSFEMDLIQNYDKSLFTGTMIYTEMVKDKVAKAY